jgi:hypothetical protein
MEKKAQLDATIDSLRANPKQIIRLTDENTKTESNQNKK